MACVFSAFLKWVKMHRIKAPVQAARAECPGVLFACMAAGAFTIMLMGERRHADKG